MVRLLLAAGVLPATLLILPTALPAQCNNAPIAQNDVTEASFRPILIDVLANDSDPDGEILTASVVSDTCPGTVTVDFDLLRFDPQGSLASGCAITYEVRDERGATDRGTAQVNLLPGFIFGDSFESGSLSQWEGCVPSCP